MDAVERGESFIVTRDGRSMGQLIPLRRRFISREQFANGSQHAQTPNLEQFRSDSECARRLGQLCAAMLEYGRQSRRRTSDLMIASTATVLEVPLYTTNPDDYLGLEAWVDLRPVKRPKSSWDESLSHYVLHLSHDVCGGS